MTELSEQKVQKKLSRKLIKKSHKCVVPNPTFFGAESDLVSVTKSDFVIEYEIKTSRQNFRSEMRAYEMVGGSYGKDAEYKSYSWSKRKKHRWMKKKSEGKHSGSISVPNRFYLVCPKGMVEESEIPDLWGLYEIRSGDDYLSVLKDKQAKKIHSEKADKSMMEDIAHILSFRLWTDKGEIIR